MSLLARTLMHGNKRPSGKNSKSKKDRYEDMPVALKERIRAYCDTLMQYETFSVPAMLQVIQSQPGTPPELVLQLHNDPKSAKTWCNQYLTRFATENAADDTGIQLVWIGNGRWTEVGLVECSLCMKDRMADEVGFLPCHCRGVCQKCADANDTGKCPRCQEPFAGHVSIARLLKTRL